MVCFCSPLLLLPCKQYKHTLKHEKNSHEWSDNIVEYKTVRACTNNYFRVSLHRVNTAINMHEYNIQEKHSNHQLVCRGNLQKNPSTTTYCDLPHSLLLRCPVYFQPLFIVTGPLLDISAAIEHRPPERKQCMTCSDPPPTMHCVVKHNTTQHHLTKNCCILVRLK